MGSTETGTVEKTLRFEKIWGEVQIVDFPGGLKKSVKWDWIPKQGRLPKTP